jgi:hypothetical protein
MDIITGITTAIATLKTGFEIKKLAGNLDSDVKQNELQIEILKLQEVLIFAQKEILKQRELIQEKDQEIKRFTKLLEEKEALLSQKNAQKGEDSLPSECVEVLRLLATVEEELDTYTISTQSNLSKQKAQYSLDFLVTKEFVEYSINANQ